MRLWVFSSVFYPVRNRVSVLVLLPPYLLLLHRKSGLLWLGVFRSFRRGTSDPGLGFHGCCELFGMVVGCLPTFLGSCYYQCDPPHSVHFIRARGVSFSLRAKCPRGYMYWPVLCLHLHRLSSSPPSRIRFLFIPAYGTCIPPIRYY